MSEVRKYSWPLSLSHWKCRCLGVKKKKKSGLKIFAIAIFSWIWGFGIF